MSSLKVLYEDNHLIAVFKPAGVLSQGDETGDVSLLDEVKTYLKETYKKPGNVFLGLLHRLDRPACGVVLFAKTSKGAARLSEQFRNHTIGKTYQVMVCGKPKQQSGTLVNHLIKDEKLKKARHNSAPGSGAVEVKLFYEVIKSNGKHSLLKVRIEGGKFHQIRSQLSIAGFPILGDVKYKGEKWENDKAIALCATQLSFIPATANEAVKVTAEVPS